MQNNYSRMHACTFYLVAQNMHHSTWTCDMHEARSHCHYPEISQVPPPLEEKKQGGWGALKKIKYPFLPSYFLISHIFSIREIVTLASGQAIPRIHSIRTYIHT